MRNCPKFGFVPSDRVSGLGLGLIPSTMLVVTAITYENFTQYVLLIRMSSVHGHENHEFFVKLHWYHASASGL